MKTLLPLYPGGLLLFLFSLESGKNVRAPPIPLRKCTRITFHGCRRVTCKAHIIMLYGAHFTLSARHSKVIILIDVSRTVAAFANIGCGASRRLYRYVWNRSFPNTVLWKTAPREHRELFTNLSCTRRGYWSHYCFIYYSEIAHCLIKF